MSTTTPRLGLTKPDQGEQYNVDITNANFQAVDTAIAALQDETTPGAATVLTGSVTNVDAAKYAIQFAQGIKMGNVVQLDMRVRRTGATIGSGNVTNEGMFTLPAGWRPILVTGCTCTGFGGLISATVNVNGQVDLDSVGIDWPNAGDVSLSALFLVP